MVFMGSNPKFQHYVPACYLREFVDPKDGFVSIFSKDGKTMRRQKPEKTFGSTHLYTIEIKGTKNYKIEQTLSTIEGKYADIFKNKIKKKLPLPEQEHDMLCVFVAAQLQRTLRFKRNQEGFMQQMIDHGTQMSLAHGVTDSKQVKEWTEYKKDIHKLELVESLPFLANILKQMTVAFLCSPDPIKHPFISSDDPCVLFNPDLQWQRFYSPGFGQQNVQLTLPLSPEITVLFSWANYHGYGLLKATDVENLNRMTRGHCDKEFISCFPKKKWIWFHRLPLDPLFFLKFLKHKISMITRDIKIKWQYRKIYDKRK
jgi:hypothetical protein